MINRIVIVALVWLASSPLWVYAADSSPKDVSSLIAPIIQKHNVPGMAVAVVQDGETVAIGTSGVRRRGKPDLVTSADRFHIGSDTKAMTAMLCGILVDEGVLKWEQTLGETFVDLNPTMHAKYQAVTLEQLLTHRGGAPGAIEKTPLWIKLWQHNGTPTSARQRLLSGVTSQPPEATPGEKFIYSNAGYSIAGHMTEKVTGESWEQLMREKVFRPLGMTTAGFGAPGTREKIDEPRGHLANGKAVEPDSLFPPADNPVAIGPAGNVHCSIGDWAKFVAANLPAAKTALVKPETLKKLHTPVGEKTQYAMGWIIADNQPWAAGPALTHSGSNSMWYAVAWLAPKKNFAVLVACNQANGKACNDAVLALIGDHFKEN